MGNMMSPYASSNPDIECFVLAEYGGCQNNSFSYPSAISQVTQRIKPEEWVSFQEALKGNNYILFGASLLCFILFIVMIFVSTSTGFAAIFVIFIPVVVIMYAVAFFYYSSLYKTVRAYNTELFRHRGMKLRFIAGGKHRPSCVHIKFAYPATPMAADALVFHHHNTCCTGSQVSVEHDSELATRFAAANESFAASPLALSSQGGPVLPQFGGGIAPQPTVAYAGPQNVVTAAYPSQPMIQVQVTVPPKALPGQLVLVSAQGNNCQVQIPQGVQPGEVFIANIPLQQHPVQAQYLQVPQQPPMVEATPVNF